MGCGIEDPAVIVVKDQCINTSVYHQVKDQENPCETHYKLFAYR
jgi:hypothetical protein